jgi:hypothetical protein
MYEIHAHVRDRSLAQWLLREQVSIRLWFGSPLPSVTMLQAARSELDRLIMIHC